MPDFKAQLFLPHHRASTTNRTRSLINPIILIKNMQEKQSVIRILTKASHQVLIEKDILAYRLKVTCIQF